MGFVQEEEEKETTTVVGEECYDYESESDDDDDVDRYVFLARQPAPAAEASSDDDDEDGAAPGGGGGGRGRKRLLREWLDAPAMPSKVVKKARLDHLTTTLAPSRKAAEAGSEEAVGCLPDRGKDKKHGRYGGGKLQVQQSTACGKRSRVPDRHATTDMAVASAEGGGASTDRFTCNICERCFGSHQALGGHVRGHTKRAKHDVAGAIREEKTAGASTTSAVAANSNQVVFSGNGDNESEDDMIGAGHERATGNGRDEEEEMDIGAGNHIDHDGDGDVKEDEKGVSPPSDRCTDGNGTGKRKNRKVAVRRCHKLATSSANKVARAVEHRCEECGKECLSGQALGGHMRKHRTRQGHGGEGRSAARFALRRAVVDN